jgi:hypothetical protein
MAEVLGRKEDRDHFEMVEDIKKHLPRVFRQRNRNLLYRKQAFWLFLAVAWWKTIQMLCLKSGK